LLIIIALLVRLGLVSNAKIMYIKVTSHCLIHYQSIVGKLYTIKSEDKFTQSPQPILVDRHPWLIYNKLIQNLPVDR
jgi:hypothetical protein